MTEQPAPPFSAEQRAEAIDLVRALAALAGDQDRIVHALEAYTRLAGYDAAVRTCLAALVVTFADCITLPVSLDTGQQVPVHIP